MTGSTKQSIVLPRRKMDCFVASLHAMTTVPLHLDAALNKDAFGAVVPDIHLHDLAVLHPKPTDVAIALERGAVDPFAVQRADAVDHGLAGAGTNVEPVHLLLHPAIALRIEAGRSARMRDG